MTIFAHEYILDQMKGLLCKRISGLNYLNCLFEGSCKQALMRTEPIVLINARLQLPSAFGLLIHWSFEWMKALLGFTCWVSSTGCSVFDKTWLALWLMPSSQYLLWLTDITHQFFQGHGTTWKQHCVDITFQANTSFQRIQHNFHCWKYSFHNYSYLSTKIMIFFFIH